MSVLCGEHVSNMWEHLGNIMIGEYVGTVWGVFGAQMENMMSPSTEEGGDSLPQPEGER